MTPPLRLLAVLAHPDDESLGFGGTIARYAAEGVETFVLTATRGQSGRFRGIPKGDPGHPGPEALARIREGELRAAVEVLGIRESILLDYMDGRLDEAPHDEAIGIVAKTIRRLRPQVVITFAWDGAYGHPDHIAVCQFAIAACVAAADPASRLPGLEGSTAHAVSKIYVMATTQAMWDAYQWAFKKLTSTVDGVERQAVAWPDWMPTTRIDTRAQWERVWKAVSCHDSQIAAYERLHQLSPEHHEALWGSMNFYRVFSTVNGGRRHETDLFEGLREAEPARPEAKLEGLQPEAKLDGLQPEAKLEGFQPEAKLEGFQK
jgi:LmbE family N-acetylglucosaminyl deacetylase